MIKHVDFFTGTMVRRGAKEQEGAAQTENPGLTLNYTVIQTIKIPLKYITSSTGTRTYPVTYRPPPKNSVLVHYSYVPVRTEDITLSLCLSVCLSVRTVLVPVYVRTYSVPVRTSTVLVLRVCLSICLVCLRSVRCLFCLSTCMAGYCDQCTRHNRHSSLLATAQQISSICLVSLYKVNIY